MSNQEIGDLIRCLRVLRGKSQQELANALKINVSGVSRIEAGKVPITVTRLNAIADALKARLRIELVV